MQAKCSDDLDGSVALMKDEIPCPKGQQMAVSGYGRVSTKEQTTENQRREIEAAGYALDYWHADEGVSGKVAATQRSQFAKMLGQIRDGETLVVTKLDRLGRDAQDVGATIKMLAARRIEVIVLQLGKLDMTSAASKLMHAGRRRRNGARLARGADTVRPGARRRKAKPWAARPARPKNSAW